MQERAEEVQWEEKGVRLNEVVFQDGDDGQKGSEALKEVRS